MILMGSLEENQDLQESQVLPRVPLQSRAEHLTTAGRSASRLWAFSSLASLPLLRSQKFPSLLFIVVASVCT